MKGIRLKKVRVPLGVVGIIYESRPNVTLEAAALALKSGNAVILKGGKEAINTNREIVSCIHKAFKKQHLPKEIVLFLDTADRRVVDALIKADKYIDILIPRGGYELVKKVQVNSTIPVLAHSAGGARIYIDKSADINKALRICLNAKINRPATCNSLDTVVVHKGIAGIFLPKFYKLMSQNGVEIRNNYETEFLDKIVAIKVVKDVNGAIRFIKKYSKGHSEGIIAVDKRAIEKFVQEIDAAGLFVNCSTRLHDGFIFGLGAEIGIATAKLHARGPVGLKELTTYKWIAYGKGQIRE